MRRTLPTVAEVVMSRMGIVATTTKDIAQYVSVTFIREKMIQAVYIILTSGTYGTAFTNDSPSRRIGQRAQGIVQE